jgi:ubiquinone/menaquinone biosynthesis C-methylase UbiE
LIMNNAQSEHIEWGKMYNQLAKKETSEICASSRYAVISEKVIRNIEKDIVSKLQLNAKDALLDLGCGTGLISINISRYVKKITGMDLGHNVLLRAGKNFKAADRCIELIQGDITSLPFKDKAFDKVLCYGVVMCFHDYNDFKNALSEMLRVCRLGGKILIGDIPDIKKKNEWIKGTRRNNEPLFSYYRRKIRQDIVKFRYKISAYRFKKRKEKLNIAPPQAAGMFYESERILNICREIGVKGTIIDQPSNLAFGNTRVDLLMEK